MLRQSVHGHSIITYFIQLYLKIGKWNNSIYRSLENLTNYQRARGLISKINIFQTIRIIFKIKNLNLIFRFIVHYLIFYFFKINIFEKKSNFKKVENL